MELPDGTLSVLAPDWKVRSNSARPNILPLEVRIPGRDTTVAFGVTSQMLSHTEVPGKRLVAIDERRITERCEIEVEVGSECQLAAQTRLNAVRQLQPVLARSRCQTP